MADAGVVSAILGKEFRQTWRDRSVLILVFLMPLALACITTFAFTGLGSAGNATIGVVDGDGGASARVLVNEVLPGLGASTGPGSGTALIRIVHYTSAAAADSAVTAGTAAAAIVIPSGFSAAVQAGRAATLTLLTGSSDSLGVPVATSVLDGFTAQIGTNALSVALAGSGTGARGVPPSLVTAANAQRSPVVLRNVLAGNGTLKASSFFAPSMMILALFFSGQMLARGLVAERRTRTLARILLAGVRPARLLLAKYLMALATGLASALVVLGLFAAFGSRFGNPWVLVLLVVLSATAMMSAASLAVLASRTEEQAGTLGTVVIFVLAILGGNFVPLSQTHGFLGSIALLTPNGWAIRGFADLSVASSGALSSVGTTLLVLAGFTVVLGVPVVLLSSRVLHRGGLTA